jgi:hypothetical protein
VDELRGTMLRLGAQQGLLVTTSTFAPATREAVSAAQHALPIRLIDGRELCALLARHGVEIGGYPTEKCYAAIQTRLSVLQPGPAGSGKRRKPPVPPIDPTTGSGPQGLPRTVVITVTVRRRRAYAKHART